MEWNWKMKNGMTDVTPFLLFESSADSEDAIADDILRHHHHHHNHHQEKHEEKEEEAMDEDVESCSYDHHSFHVNVKTIHDNHHQVHEYDDGDDHDHGHDGNREDIDADADDDDDDDDDDNNWGESKMMGQEKRFHELCVDSSNLDDRQFWETCLGS